MRRQEGRETAAAAVNDGKGPVPEAGGVFETNRRERLGGRCRRVRFGGPRGGLCRRWGAGSVKDEKFGGQEHGDRWPWRPGCRRDRSGRVVAGQLNNRTARQGRVALQSGRGGSNWRKRRFERMELRAMGLNMQTEQRLSPGHVPSRESR